MREVYRTYENWNGFLSGVRSACAYLGWEYADVKAEMEAMRPWRENEYVEGGNFAVDLDPALMRVYYQA